MQYIFCIVDAEKLFCCYGYCMDLLKGLEKEVNFTYDLHLSKDGMFGSYEHVSLIFM